MANKTLNTRIVIRNDTSANWTINKNKVLLKGEIGLETNTNKYKIGDGSTTWENLTYYKHVTDSAGGGLVDDVKVDGTSVVSSKIASLSTINGDYDASTNKLATEDDIPTTASEVGALPDSTKYGASLGVSGTSVTLKDQDGNTLSTITTQDTGATTLAGNNSETDKAFISASIDNTTRTITFTKGTFLTQHQDISGKLDKKPDGTNDLIVNNKVSTTYLPDQILGQLLYGGTVTGAGVATLTPNAKAKLGTTSNTITLTNDTAAITGYGANDGLYYIASSDGNFASLDLLVGDWLISVGTAWKKIDNTDAVTGVKGNAENTYRLGNVEIDPDDLDDTSSTNKFVTASDKTTWNEKQDALPTTTTAGQVLKSTSTSGTTQWGTLSASDVGAEPTISTKNTAFNKNFETSSSNIKMDGTVSVGSSDNVARADHVHPSDTSKQNKNVGSANSGKILKVDSNGDIAVSTIAESNLMVDTDTFILDGGSSTTGS